MNQGLKFESRPYSAIEINPEIITLSEGAIQETSWDTVEFGDTKINCSEYPHKYEVDIQPGKKLMGG